ncbi:hypothetical protein KAR91_12815 [Candidatus Pacearchaeota archaeon]|nr:hypothetical protein [Candidatus Pacearchaeota archaeon]
MPNHLFNLAETTRQSNQAERQRQQNRLLRGQAQNQPTAIANQNRLSELNIQRGEAQNQLAQRQLTAEEFRQENAQHAIAAERDATTLETIRRLPEGQRQQAYQQVVGQLDMGVQQQMPQWNDVQAQDVINQAQDFQEFIKGPKRGRLTAGVDGGKPGFFQQDPRTGDLARVPGAQPTPKKGISVTTPGGTSIQIGGSGEQTTPLDKVGARKEKTEIIKAEKTLATIASINKLYNPDYFTYEAAGLQWLSSKAKKLGISKSAAVKKMTQGRTKLFNEIRQFFNAYRKDITGAAASITELELLMLSTINPDQDSDDFEASLEQLTEATLRGRRLHQRILREGVPVNSDEYEVTHNALWGSGEDDDPEARGEELVDQGMTFEQATEQLKKEGYR